MTKTPFGIILPASFRFFCLTLNKLFMAKKLFIFDADGVLLDLWGSMKSVYEEFFSQKLSSREWDGVIADYLRNPEPYALFGQYFDNTDALTRLPPVNGMPDLVKSLKELGFDLAVATGRFGPRRHQEQTPFQLGTGLWQRFYADILHRTGRLENHGSD